MRILFLTNIPSPYRVDFFEELGKSCELTVLYEKKAAADRDENWIKKLEGQNYKSIYLKPLWEKTDTALCLEVKKYLNTKQYDYIVVGGYSTPTGMLAIRYMKKHDIPYWISVDGATLKEESSWKYRLKNYLLSGAAGYFSPAKKTDEWLVHYGAQKDRIHRYPFTSVKASDVLEDILEENEKDELKKELGISEKNVVLSVGQFIYRKGYDILLKAISPEMPDTGVYIIGGTITEEYRKLIEENGFLHVHFLPFMEKEKLSKYYETADLFVMPTREDIWGLVINEALAKGLSIVTSDACLAGLELVEDGVNGRVVPAENVKELRKTILDELELGNDETRLRKENSLLKAKEYTIEKMAQSHMDVWENNSKNVKTGDN